MGCGRLVTYSRSLNLLLSSFFHQHVGLTDPHFTRKNQDLTTGLYSQEKPTSSSHSRMDLSFLQDMSLVMRIDKRIKRTATDIVNKEDEKSLADLNYEFSLDRASRLIARFIVRETELHYVF